MPAVRRRCDLARVIPPIVWCDRCRCYRTQRRFLPAFGGASATMPALSDLARRRWDSAAEPPLLVGLDNYLGLLADCEAGQPA